MEVYFDSVENFKFIKAQTNAIEASKFIESKKLNKDLYYDASGRPSQYFYMQWIDEHSREFRAAWCGSVCRHCSKVTVCFNCLRNSCSEFDQDQNN